MRVNWYLPSVTFDNFISLSAFDRHCLMDALERCIMAHNDRGDDSDGNPPHRSRKS